jgi:hypothetical protein
VSWVRGSCSCTDGDRDRDGDRWVLSRGWWYGWHQYVRELELETLSDGCVRVCLGEGRTRVCATVSSMHLVEDKRKQLERAGRDRGDAVSLP